MGPGASVRQVGAAYTMRWHNTTTGGRMTKSEILAHIQRALTTHIAFDKESGLSHFHLIDGISRIS